MDEIIKSIKIIINGIEVYSMSDVLLKDLNLNIGGVADHIEQKKIMHAISLFGENKIIIEVDKGENKVYALIESK